jgi:hypothetical protein
MLQVKEIELHQLILVDPGGSVCVVYSFVRYNFGVIKLTKKKAAHRSPHQKFISFE